MSARTTTILIVLGLAFLLLGSSMFIVKQTEQAIVLQFGRPVQIIRTPGLHFKLPFVQNVLTFDRRLLTYNAQPESYLTMEKKSLIVDSFAEWKIVDPLRFYTTVRNEMNASARLADLIRSGLRAEFGKRNIEQVVSGDRMGMISELNKVIDRRAQAFGIKVVDIRLIRVDLPQKVEQSVYRRMEAERSREAKEYRSRGEEIAEQIRSNADRQKTVLLAEAYRKAQEIKGQGDAQAAHNYAQAYNADPKFFAFYRSMQAYRKSLGKNDVMVVEPDSQFFKYYRAPGNK